MELVGVYVFIGRNVAMGIPLVTGVEIEDGNSGTFFLLEVRAFVLVLVRKLKISGYSSASNPLYGERWL